MHDVLYGFLKHVGCLTEFYLSNTNQLTTDHLLADPPTHRPTDHNPPTSRPNTHRPNQQYSI